VERMTPGSPGALGRMQIPLQALPFGIGEIAGMVVFMPWSVAHAGTSGTLQNTLLARQSLSIAQRVQRVVDGLLRRERRTFARDTGEPLFA
jgi:hypothetical protein